MKDRTLKLTASPSDAVAVGPLLLGFQPVESVVVVAYNGREVVFCARADLSGAMDCGSSVLGVMSNADVDGIELAGYSADPLGAASALHGVATGPLDGLVFRQHVTDGETAWRCDAGMLLNGERLAATVETPQATRADCVADVTGPRQPASSADVRDRLHKLSADERETLLMSALLSDEPLARERAADAAGLLGASVPGFAYAMANPERVYSRAVEMRRWCSDEHYADTLGLIALAAWASGKGAPAAEAVAQLHTISPRLARQLTEVLSTNPSHTRI